MTAIVVWPTVTEITVKKITRRLSLWVKFPSGGCWFHILSNLCWFPTPVVSHDPQGEQEEDNPVVMALSCTEMDSLAVLVLSIMHVHVMSINAKTKEPYGAEGFQNDLFGIFF